MSRFPENSRTFSCFNCINFRSWEEVIKIENPAISDENFSHKKEVNEVHKMKETFGISDSVFLDAKCVPSGKCQTLLDRYAKTLYEQFLRKKKGESNYVDTKR